MCSFIMTDLRQLLLRNSLKCGWLEVTRGIIASGMDYC